MSLSEEQKIEVSRLIHSETNTMESILSRSVISTRLGINNIKGLNSFLESCISSGLVVKDFIGCYSRSNDEVTLNDFLSLVYSDHKQCNRAHIFNEIRESVDEPLEALPNLLPLKYKIKTKGGLHNVLRYDLKAKNVVLKNVFGGQSAMMDLWYTHNCDNNHNTSEMTLSVAKCVFEYLVAEERNLHREISVDNYLDSRIIAEDWKLLYNSFANPLLAFQDIFFEYILNKDLQNTLGVKLSYIIEEVLRDGVVTPAEMNYTLEVADRLGYSRELVKKEIDKRLNDNPALTKFVYEICRDFIISESEEKVLVEKAFNYNISKNQLLAEVNAVGSRMENLHSLFFLKETYDIVSIFFLLRYINPLGDEYQELILSIFSEILDYQGGYLAFTKINLNECMDYIISILNTRIHTEYLNSDISVYDLVYSLGIYAAPHSEIIEFCRQKNTSFYKEHSLSKIFDSTHSLDEKACMILAEQNKIDHSFTNDISDDQHGSYNVKQNLMGSSGSNSIDADETVNRVVNLGSRFKIQYKSIGNIDFFDVENIDGTTFVIINKEHELYKKYLSKMNATDQFLFKLLLGGWACLEDEITIESRRLQLVQARKDWGMILEGIFEEIEIS